MSTPGPQPSSTSSATPISHSTVLPGSSPRSSPSSSTMSTSTSTITKTTTISVSTSSVSTPASAATPTSMSISTPALSSSPTMSNNKSSNDNKDPIKSSESNPPPTPMATAAPTAPTTTKTTSTTTTIPMIPHGTLTLKPIDTTTTRYPLSCLRTPPKWPIRRRSVPRANGAMWKAIAGMQQDGVGKAGVEEVGESPHEEEDGVATLPVFEGNGPASGAEGDVRESVEVDVDVGVDVDDDDDDAGDGDALPNYDGLYAWEAGFRCSAEVRRRNSIFHDEEKMGVWTGRVEWPESGMRSSIKREAMRRVGEEAGSDREDGEARRKRVRVRVQR